MVSSTWYMQTDQNWGKFVLLILILREFILPVQPAYSILCGKRSEKISVNTDLIRELWVKPEVRILYWCIREADVDVVVTALARGAFEFQGQKCSAASRAYLPSNLAAEIKEKLVAVLKSMKMGTVEDFSNFINAVIDEKSFDKIKGVYRSGIKRSECKNYDGWQSG